jgi:V-type H+-transporting ATPase subunit a
VWWLTLNQAHTHAEDIRHSFDNDEAPLLRDVEQRTSRTVDGDTQGQQRFSELNIGFIAGVIPRERLGTLERILWRTLRGNLYMNQSEIPEAILDPIRNVQTHKNVFLIFAHGKNVLVKIRKISESLGASLYGVDENTELRKDQIDEVNKRLDEFVEVLRNTERTLADELSRIAQSLAAWIFIVKKEKAVYHTLNKFSYDRARKMLIAEAWCPTDSLALIKSTLQDVDNGAGTSMPTVLNEVQTNRTPPTYVRTNKFTEAFQTIVNAYRTPNYSEVNPGIYMVVTFPFLFAVMFGDFGHGALVTMVAAAMIFWEKKLQRTKLDELSYMAFYGRYIMLMMGLFSMYTGLIYNDIFSRSFTIFSSQWEWPKDIEPGQTVDASLKEGYRYPIGLDWNWHEAENSLLFSNSMKMKMGILLGWAHVSFDQQVIQYKRQLTMLKMTYALCLQYINGRHFKSQVDIWGNFIPAMLFYQSIFGYLVITVIYKWSVDWQGRGESPPSLLNMLIFMFLSPGTVQEQLYPYQGTVQVLLLVIAAMQVPVMLLFKPLYLRWEHNHAGALGYRSLSHQTAADTLGYDSDIGEGISGSRSCMAGDSGAMALMARDTSDDDDPEEFDFFDIMIHQAIHTIEFCLNCISHTASYLRLWALSLAHQQLSIVLWAMTLGSAFEEESPRSRVIMIVINFYLWFTLSVSILCVMEGTSAMLHSMRLHWIEAMSKHFIGEGTLFSPFSFNTILEEDPAV